VLVVPEVAAVDEASSGERRSPTQPAQVEYDVLFVHVPLLAVHSVFEK
jgi:hypothetical protein